MSDVYLEHSTTFHSNIQLSPSNPNANNANALIQSFHEQFFDIPHQSGQFVICITVSEKSSAELHISNKRTDLNQKFLVWNFYVRMAKLSNEQN